MQRKWSIGKLHLQWGHPKFDFEKRVGKYLMELERCSSKVIIVSPKYGDKHYRCEVIADTAGLLEWAEHHSKATWCSDEEIQAGLLALPLWLRGADLTNDEHSEIPYYFYKVLNDYVFNFIESGIVKIICPDCNHAVENIAMNKLNERHQINWHWWTDEWFCENGHLLYREDHELKFFCKLH